MSLFAVVLALCAAADVPAVGVPAVYVPVADVRHARGLHQRYEVRDGRLWVARDGASFGLFGGTGRVPGHDVDDIVAVFADEDEFFVVATADGFLHHHESGVFDSLWGLPSLPFTRAPLASPVDVKTLRPGQMAYSMRHKNVVHYSDARGQDFFWGNAGTTTLWVLADDGRRLLLGDPWLPPDFSREILTPDDGRARLLSIAASASTLFVVDDAGRLFTRFTDYDAFGGTPFYDYRYDAFDVEDLSGTDPRSELKTRALPLADWHEEPAPPATQLTRRIAIVQNGVGNDARELRIVGARDGVWGVFHKALRATTWSFDARAAGGGLVVDATDVIDPVASQPSERPVRAYAGFARGSAAAGLYAVTDDFFFFRDRFTLALFVDGERVDVDVDAVDAWTVLTLTNPRDDDTAPKLLKATLTVSNASALSPRTRARLREVFHDDLGRPFAFVIVANQHELRLAPVSYPWNVAAGRVEFVLRHDPRAIAQTHLSLRPATAIAQRHGVDVWGDPCRDLAAAAAARTAVGAARARLEKNAALASVLEGVVPAGTVVADAATVVTTTRLWLREVRWLTGLELHLPAVLAAQARASTALVRDSAADFSAVSARLARCAP